MKMKKWLFLVCCLTMLCGMVACGGAEDSDEEAGVTLAVNPDTTPTPTPEPTATPEPTPTPVYSDGYVWPCPGFYYLSSLFGEDRTSYAHGAIDIAGITLRGSFGEAPAASSLLIEYIGDSITHGCGLGSIGNIKF